MSESPAAARSVLYRVCHETLYHSANPVTNARQLAHLQPRSTGWQRVLQSEVKIDPAPGELDGDEDYFGNRVLRFAIDGAHDSLEVIACSEVEVLPHAPAPDSDSPAWRTALAIPTDFHAPGALDIMQYRVGSAQAPLMSEAGAYAAQSFNGNRPWLDALYELTRRMRADFKYDTKATTVFTPVADVLARRAGVCQDFAHLMISALRSLGMSARYVSGYIRNDRAKTSATPGATPSAASGTDPATEALTGADASHAWVSAYCPGHGWVDVDPTNGKIADTEFITVAWGRDFSDVTPLRGVVLGDGGQKLEVRVSVTAI